jgi:CheY-like chemotaxis protein
MAGKERILIVDDDPALRNLLRDTLSGLGYTTVTATDGADALARLRDLSEPPFDLLITDIKMPNIDGMTLLKMIRRAFPSLPVMFITGLVSEETMAAASPDGYLSKPFRIARLEELIQHALAAKRSGQRPPPPRRVLINVADNNLRDNLTEALSFGNYIPFAVAGGHEALEELERGRFDAVIAGVDAASSIDNRYLDQLREAYPDLPVFLCSTTCTSSEVREAGNRLRASGYLDQSFRPGELIALLDQATKSSDN